MIINIGVIILMCELDNQKISIIIIIQQIMFNKKKTWEKKEWQPSGLVVFKEVVGVLNFA